jgi:hypothetical protein
MSKDSETAQFSLDYEIMKQQVARRDRIKEQVEISSTPFPEEELTFPSGEKGQ